MAIETSTFIADWNSALPANTDSKSEGDDHIRKIKADVQATLPGFAGRFRRIQSKSAAYTAVLNDNGSILRTSGTWTLSGTAVATLGNGWEIIVYNDGAGTITFDPSGAELVNGAATLTIAASTWACIWCDGSAFRAIGGRTDSINIATTDTTQTFTGAKTHSGTLTMSGAAINTAARVNVASAATTNIGAAASNNVDITGTTTITAFDNVAEGIMRWCVFSTALTLTHGANLILPGSANITTAANDEALFVSRGGGAWSCRYYQRASGLAVVSRHGMQLIDTQTVSAAASMNFTTGIDGTYDELELRLEDIVPSAGSGLRLQISQDGGANYLASGYSNAATWLNSSGTLTHETADATGVLIGDTTNGVATDANEGLNGVIRLYLPAGTGHRKYFEGRTTYLQASTLATARLDVCSRFTTNNTAYNAFRIIFGTGNITGTGRLYGIRKSST